MEFLVTGNFKYTGQSFENGVHSECEETASISEIVNASSVEAAQAIADQIFARYVAKYGEVTGRCVRTYASVTNDNATTDKTATATNGKPETRLVCRKCGVVGFVGRGYSFSTLPASTCICDDCGA